MAGTTITFSGGQRGNWRIERVVAVTGESLVPAPRLDVAEGQSANDASIWQLRGVVSNARYSLTSELRQLAPVSPALGRPEATIASLIPIRKSELWWGMGQDERREIFEGRSRHISRSIRILPAVARRLHHSRDLGEPFDFLTWFEYAPENTQAFNDLLCELRETEEWKFVEREVEILLVRDH